LPRGSGGLARRAREQFVTLAEAALEPMGLAIRARLTELVDNSAGSREMYERRDALFDFERKGPLWLKGTAKAWRDALVPPTETGLVRLASSLELIGDEVVERKILSSRLALAIIEKASWELNDLRVRMQHLEGGDDFASTDILRPEALAQLLVEQWDQAEMTRQAWELVQEVIHKELLAHVPQAYHLTNEFLIKQGVMRNIDLSSRVRRGASSSGSGRKGSPDSPDNPNEPGQSGQSSQSGQSGQWGPSGGGNRSGSAGFAGGQPGGWQGGEDYGHSGQYGFAGHGGHSGQPGPHESTGGPAGRGVADETRLMTSRPALGGRMRGTGILGRLKRLLSERVAGYDQAPQAGPSPALAQALQEQRTELQDTVLHASTGQDALYYDDAAVQEVAVELRRRTGELKKKAATSTEKATIEIVALMFQSILAEERIPPAIRVWFARLQMPVLRVAIAEPEFFGSLEHPARQLIDRMGSCVMGFDATAIGGSALEVEIKRVVQVIEQYPETGRRVFQLVYDEFQKFISKFLTEKAPTQRLVSVAQQVEQKETLAIQYTIELRSMLSDMPVRDEIREFLFKVWAEVLALAAIKNGPQHEDTLALKNSASELVWAASAKPNRSERSRVIQDLPRLLQRLRQGMTLVGIQGAAQESHIKVIGDTLADAFLSKTEAIAPARIEEMASRLAHLEDFVADDPATDLPLDAESIELMLGMDASMIEVVADGGSKPSAAMLAWASELQLGNWFALDHNGATTQVQYAWRSERKQLHLFAATSGRSYLIQARRLASYLQAGLLLPAEEEALTVRATRDALAKIEANPERLLQ
jgi:hypothetical protein